jgi:predicted ATP-dependent endonuclease of OLD family
MQTTEDFSLQHHSTPALPYAITRLEVAHFQGIKHLVMNEIPTNAQWIFLTGENSFGKTSILRSIALGLVGDELPDQEYLTRSTIKLYGYRQNNSFVSKLKAKSLNRDFPIAAYGASRYQLNHLDQLQPTGKVAKKTYSLFYDDGVLRNIERVLLDAQIEDLPTFNRFKEILLKIIPGLADIKVASIRKKRTIQYAEKMDDGTVVGNVFLNELAAGYRGILTMIGDMVQRLSEYPDNSLNDLQGIVLIDEIDAHLHPKYQYQLPKLLSELFPKIQFIATTHSPLPILGLPQSIPSVVFTVSRTAGKGITADRKDDDMEIHRLSAGALLSSPVFGFEQSLPPILPLLPTEKYEAIAFVQQMKERLKSLRSQGLVK